MANRDIIVIGASTGGLQALTEMLQPLPPDLGAALFVVVHTAPQGTGLLPEILERGGARSTRRTRNRSRTGESISPRSIITC